MARILVADDMEENRVLFARILRRAGHSVSVAEDGMVALALDAAQPFDMVLLDLEMPRTDGFEAAEALRARDWAAGIRRPMLAVSAFDPRSISAKLAKADFDEYLQKPVDQRSLVGLVDRWLPAGTAPPMDADIAELLPMYIAKRREDLSRTAALVAVADWEALARIGHTLRGSSLMFALPGIAKLGTALELAARSADTSRVEALLAEIAAAVERL